MSTPEKSHIYNTPGRECSHALRGCCPKCFDPAGILKSTREFRLKRHAPAAPTTSKEQSSNGN